MQDQFGVYLYIFTLSLAHLTGFFIFFSYYLTQKKFRYLLFSIGWLLSLLGTIVFLIPYYLEDFTLFGITALINGVLVTIGTFYIGIGLLTHFFQLEDIHIYLITAVVGILPIIAFFIKSIIQFEIDLFQDSIFYFHLTSNGLNSFVTSIEQLCVYAFLFLIGFIYRKKIIQYSLVSFILYLVGVSVSFLIIFLTQFRRFQVDELPVLFNFGISIWVAMILMLFLIHLEFRISEKEKFLLKDRYSHDMAQYIQLAMGNLDLIKETNDPELYSKLQNNLNDTTELLSQIREI